MTEKQIAKMMKSLDISREEAIAVIKEDEAVDKMSMKEVDSDLTAEQKKAKKKATNTTGDKSKRAYTFTKRERKPDDVKRKIISIIAQNLYQIIIDTDEDYFIPQNTIIKNPEKEITFLLKGDEYSITLTKHRKPKGD